MDNEKSLTKNEVVTYEKLKQKWKDLSQEDIILDALYSNQTRYAQEYFDKILKFELTSNRIIEIGLKSALQLLADKDLRWAEKLFNNMSFDSNTKIYQICFYTPYKELRDYLITILNERKLLNDNEIKMVEYLKKVEDIYSLKSFVESKNNENWSAIANNRIKNENFKCDETVKFSKYNEFEKRFKYKGNYVLEWIREWSDENCNRIIIDGLMTHREGLNSEFKNMNSNHLWSYLLDHLNFDFIYKWVDFSFGDIAQIEIEFPCKLNDEMIEYGVQVLFYSGTHEYLLNKLAQYNVFINDENENLNFESHVNRLSSSLTFYNAPKSVDFNKKFILNILDNHNIDILWSYFDYIGDSAVNNIKFENEKHEKSLNMFKEYRNMSIEKSNLFTTCMTNIEYLLNMSNLSIESLSQMNGFDLSALALALNTDTPISSNLSANFTHLLEIYPALRLIIDNKNFQQNVSLYTLLQEHSKIDVTKFFTWQSSNQIALKENTDTNTNLEQNILSFDNQEFTKRYAYKDQLDYSFFLKQGRPFFAYYIFTTYQFKKYAKLHKTLLEEARVRTHIIAIKNYESSRIVSSCIVFSELINGNHFKIKLHIYLMKHILYDYYKKRGLDHSKSSKKCKSVLLDFLKGDIEANRLATILENALVTLMSENFDQNQMFTMNACSLWLPLMCFCKIYGLPYSSKYLSLCAESNNWLMFLIFAQLYQLPKFQVISNLEYFKDVGLKQHLDYALHNVINSPKSGSNEAKTGLELTKKPSFTNKHKKGKKPNRKFSGRMRVDSSEEENDYFEADKSVEVEIKAVPSHLDSIDFYELLINCQNSTDPIKQLQIEALKWSTPILSVFAVFYSQHDKISCLCTFLYASLKYEYIEDNNNKNEKNILFKLDDLKIAIQTTALRGFMRTLLNSLKIFMLGSILEIYVDFLYNVFIVKDVVKAQQLYSNYKYELIKVTLSKHQSYVPLEWYEDVISKLTRITILKSRTIGDLKNLTNILSQMNEYRKLIKLVYILKSNKLTVNSDEWLTLNDKSDQFTEICFKVIEELLKIHKFNEAEDLADYCELSKDRIHLARIGRQIDILRLNNDFDEILEFWKSAHVELLKIGIKDADFIDFLKFQNTRSNLTLEKIVLLNLICQLHPNDQETSKNLWLLLLQLVIDYKKRSELQNLREIFKKMLLFGQLNSNPIKELIDLILIEKQIVDFNNNMNTLSEQNTEALNILLYNLIDIGKLAQSYVISKYFKYFNQDLRILLNMLYVSLNMIQPNNLDYSIQTFDSTSFKGIKLTNVLRSLSRSSDSTEIVKDRIDCLEKLEGLCNHGNKYCQKIKLDFRLSNELLRIDYKQILNQDKWNLLRYILNSSHKAKYNLAKEFVNIYELDDEQLCTFLLEEMLLALKNYFFMNQENMMMSSNKQSLFDPNSNEEFLSLIKVFKNSTLFGTKLLEKTRVQLNEARTTEDFNILTELLIRSHDCFIQSCSMEGISNVLQICKICATKLEKAGEFNIMIRLLTGVAHFNEMTYIMDYLWNNHKFEMLFGKGIGKEGKLRLALLDYLKRYHPNDNETYTMVTLNFTMHREIAKMLEEAAFQQLKILEKKQIENTAEILTDLQSILQYFSDAAQSFMKEDCVKQAEACIRKARLIALQINFLSSNRIIINLNNTAVSKFIVNHSRFWESYIVSEAYDRKADWSQAIFNQYIINGNEKYLVDFKGHIQLTTNIIEEVANRYKISNENSRLPASAVLNMKKLLKNCKDIAMYYKLAAQLDFKDTINEILTKKYASIINDLILNKKLI